MRLQFLTLTLLLSGCGFLGEQSKIQVAPAAAAPSALSANGYSTSSNQTPMFTWTGTPDASIGTLEKYQLSIGTSPGAQDIYGWTDVGLVTQASLSGNFTLTEGSDYYGNLRAKSVEGTFSSSIASNKFTYIGTAKTLDEDLQTTISPKIRFYRASTGDAGTYYNSQGYIKSAVANLILQSETLNTSWTPTQTTVNADVATSPNGATVAEKILENGVSADHYLTATSVSGLVSGQTYTFSIYAKADGRTHFSLRLDGTSFSSQTAIFDLGTGTSTGTQNSPAGSGITSIGNDWYRAWVSATATAAGTGIARIYLRDDTNTTPYLGLGTPANLGIFAWGAQLEQNSSPSSYTLTTTAKAYGPRFDYDPTTCSSGTCTTLRGLLVENARINRILHSEDFTTTWSPTGATVTSNPGTVTDPTGLTGAADLAKEDTSTGEHKLGQASLSYTTNVVQAASVFVKPNGRTRFKLKVFKTTTTADSIEAVYDTDTQNTSCVVSGGTAQATSLQARIKALRNGWYRLELIGMPSTTTSTATMEISFVDSGCNTSYTGDNTSGAYLFGGQFEAGQAVSSYIATTTAVVTRPLDNLTFPDNTPWSSVTEGTLQATYQLGSDNQGGATYWPFLMRLCDVSNCNANRIEIQSGRNRVGIYIITNNVSTYGSGIDTVPAYSVVKANFSYQGSGADSTSDGISGASSTSAALPTLNSSVFNSYDIWMKKIEFWPKKFNSFQLQQLSQ